MPDRTTVTLPSATGYWVESRWPLVSLVFVCPLLLAYEIGVLALGPEAVRNGADVWLRQLLDAIGFGQYFLLPVLTVCLLLAWHYTTGLPWRVPRGVLSGMLGECLVLALCLRVILEVQGRLLAGITGRAGLLTLDLSGLCGRAVGFLGAGVYEELLFRLMLFSGAVWLLRRLGLKRPMATAGSVVLTSLSFAGAHYIGPHGEPVAWSQGLFWFSFSFRFLAGVFFSLLFVYRGFGIAAGAHAGYDILVGIVQF
ncbi:MAG TPA: CPBP family intramembrane metalloprotease [Planctomycetaceae bacterium]|nr:CPBP family intramembrane metalloprotease [Planctomycetaceae bacterium]HIQ20207.1 CPBP family intramembrane metalloprotease [Planctomycetota bacterium]